MSGNSENMIVTLIFWFAGICIYFLPSAIAASRKHRNGSAIFLTNLFFGWSCLGWIIAVIWAHTANTEDNR